MSNYEVGIVGACEKDKNLWQPFISLSATLRIYTQADWDILKGKPYDMHGSHFDLIVCEHVLEHFYYWGEALQVLRNLSEYLKPDGTIRIAVPDKNNPYRAYHRWNRPHGLGQFISSIAYRGFKTHQWFYDVHDLGTLCDMLGFAYKPLEWYDSDGNFHCVEWDNLFIKRSVSNPYSQKFTKFHGAHNHSLIVNITRPFRRA